MSDTICQQSPRELAGFTTSTCLPIHFCNATPEASLKVSLPESKLNNSCQQARTGVGDSTSAGRQEAEPTQRGGLG